MKNYQLVLVSVALSLLGALLLFVGIRQYDRACASSEATECFAEIRQRTDHLESLIEQLAMGFQAKNQAKNKDDHDEDDEDDEDDDDAVDRSGLFHELSYPLTTDADFLWAEWLVPAQTADGRVFEVAYAARRELGVGNLGSGGSSLDKSVGTVRQLEGALENAIHYDLFLEQMQEQHGVFLSKRLHLEERDHEGVLAAVRPVYGDDEELQGLAVGYFRSMLFPAKACDRRVCMEIFRTDGFYKEPVASLGGTGLIDTLLDQPVNRGCEQYQVVISERPSQFQRRARLSLFGLLLGPAFACSMLRRYWRNRAVEYESHCQDLSTEVSERREMQETLQQLLALREDERRTVASDIHDGFVQEVVSAQMFLEALSARIDEDDSQVATCMRHLRNSIQQAIAEGRRLVRRTQVLAVDDIGLLSATHRLVAEHREKFGLEVTLRFAENIPELDILQQRSVYRVIQESLNNVRRHSGANEAIVSLYTVDGQFCVDIADQGKGFDISQMSPDSYGIRGMRERVETMSGELTFKSAVGEGTLVSLRLPLQPESDGPKRAELETTERKSA